MKTVVSSFGFWASLWCTIWHRGDHDVAGALGYCRTCARSWWR